MNSLPAIAFRVTKDICQVRLKENFLRVSFHSKSSGKAAELRNGKSFTTMMTIFKLLGGNFQGEMLLINDKIYLRNRFHVVIDFSFLTSNSGEINESDNVDVGVIQLLT